MVSTGTSATGFIGASAVNVRLRPPTTMVLGAAMNTKATATSAFANALSHSSSVVIVT